MTRVRLVSYVLDPYADEKRPVAALIADASGVRVIRAEPSIVPAAARANLERVLRDLEAAPDIDALPLGTGAQLVVGEARVVPDSVRDPSTWARRALLPEAA